MSVITRFNDYSKYSLETIEKFYTDSVETIGSTAEKWKKFRNDPALFQKICYLGKSSVDGMNALRSTNKLIKLSKVLGGAALTDFFEPISSALAYMKPVNVNTVHVPALVKIINSTGLVQVGQSFEDQTTNDLDQFLTMLSDIECGQQFGFADSAGFLLAYQHFVTQKRGLDYFNNCDLTTKIEQVPLIHVRWGEWLTGKSFEVLGIMTVTYYFKEWNFIETASWAAKIGQVQGFNWVNIVSFGVVFQGVILTSFACALAVAVRKIYAKYKSDPSISPSAKARARYEAVGSLVEAVYAGKVLLTDLNIIKYNPLFLALSLFADKSIGSICIVEKPPLQRDTPMSQVAKPKVIDRINSKVTALFSPLKKLPGTAYLTTTAEKINNFVTTILEVSNDFVNLEKDGFDRLYKIVIPALLIIDRAFKQSEAVTNAVFKKCISSMQWHKDLIYATKIFNTIPHWIARNPETKKFNFTTPFYIYNKAKRSYRFQPIDGLSTALLDISAVGDLTKFIRKNELYRFDYFVNIGNQIAEKQISVFGYSVVVKDIPALGKINQSPKEIFVVLNSLLRLGEQVFKRIKGDKQQFQGKKLSDFVGHIGKIVVCSIKPTDTYLFDFICLLTSASGLSYLVGQHKLRQKIKARHAVAA